MNLLNGEILESLNLPRDRATINAWCRSFHMLNPVVNLAIELHTSALTNHMTIQHDLPRAAEEAYEHIWGLLDLKGVLTDYWVLGECFTYLELDEHTGNWDRMKILNPDYVSVRRDIVSSEPLISLRPDEELRRVVLSNTPSCMAQREKLDPAIVDHVRRGENIPLSNFYVTHLCLKSSPYDLRGSSLLVPVLDLLRKGEINTLVKQILCYPEEGSLSTDVLRGRLQRTGAMIRTWLERKVFGPIARINEWYSPEKALLVPQITFDIERGIEKFREVKGL